MAQNEIEIRARPDDVFRVLVDPAAYGFWVVGPDAVVDVSDDWPSVGARFTYQAPAAALRMRDVTEIEEIDAPRRLVLRANGRPIGAIARVCFELADSGESTSLTMTETPIGGVWRPLWNPVLDRLLWARNVQALQRLRVLVEGRDGDGAQALEARAERPGITTALSLGTTLTFWALSAARGKRIFHPVGETYEGELTIDEAHTDLVRFLESMETRRAIMRLSKGAGTPGALPDVYGLAIKFPDAWGAEADQDFLFVTSGGVPAARHVLLPTIAPLSSRFSSILPYELDGRTLILGARATQRDTASRDDLRGATFSFDAAPPVGSWQRAATITVTQRLGGDVSFDPWNSSPRLVPAGILNALRRSAYAGSRTGRSTR